MSGKIAILGAGGFLGARLVEMAALAGDDSIVPVLRFPRGLARLSRLAPEWRQGDAGDPVSLAAAVKDCTVVVNLTMGGVEKIVSDTQSILNACRAAGVQRLIHMSSASVYGLVPAPELPDDAPPDLGLWMEYAREKGRAENLLRANLAGPGPEIVVLRPGMIWGPGSIWLSGPAGALQRGGAFLLNGGQGPCNLIHVDNLCCDILSAARNPGRVGGFYHVADDEQLTWRDYYEALAAEIGVAPDSIHRVEMREWREGWLQRLAGLKDLALARMIKRRMSKESKMRIKRVARETWARIRPAADQIRPGPELDKVMCWNQSTRHFLPTAKFRRTFGRDGRNSFAVSVTRAGTWLRFAGFGNDPYGDPTQPAYGSRP